MAFLPSPDPIETSVFRTVELAESGIWSLGKHAGEQRRQSLRGRGDVLARTVFSVGLTVRPDNQPRRHAAIVGWPMAKDEQLTLAQQLAEAATLHLPS